ncbi:uncharacterized protein LOC126785116 [Argentina anserina]|uniref:uncharacterized protein LOC126785116 n=1 Tax=Argentina anserina TaxID=57926 RepID=UPI0021765DFD|nr:uncharacterized protein LOC126785116 [Potentilla anserina]
MAGPNFEALRNLHNSANDLLHSPLIQQALVRNSQEKWVHEVSEASLKLLDVCSISKDVLFLVKEHLQDLQFTLRRVNSSGEEDIGSKMTAYNVYRNKLKKETLKCLDSLKCRRPMKSKSSIVSLELFPIDQNLTVVVDVLRQVRVTTVSIVETLLSLISIPWLDEKSSRSCTASFMSKFICGRSQKVHDLCDATALQSANTRLDAVEIAIQDLQVELECMFRRLIDTRVALLNILTN